MCVSQIFSSQNFFFRTLGARAPAVAVEGENEHDAQPSCRAFLSIFPIRSGRLERLIDMLGL